jgi:hypothetical protein
MVRAITARHSSTLRYNFFLQQYNYKDFREIQQTMLAEELQNLSRKSDLKGRI